MKIFDKVKQFLKENYKQIIVLVIFMIVVNVELPYYIEAPGGAINLSERIDNDYKKNDGSLNMLYVTEYRGNVVTLLLGKIIKSWDIYEISNQQVSNETSEEIYLRNKVMLDNSIQNAMMVAYKYAGKEIKIKGKKNIVLFALKDNGIKVGDVLLKIDDQVIDNIDDIKAIIDIKNVGDDVELLVNRNNKEKKIKVKLDDDKLLGITIITNYDYELPDDLNINFKSSEGGSSGGLVLALGIYSQITDIDILKGRNIAGTGTIDTLGNVGKIDGIKYKIAGAVRDKMDVVLVASDNYEEAKQVVMDNNYDIELVEVSTFDKAIEYLLQ